MSKPVEVNDQNFQQEVIESRIPVILDVWAPWCMPCRVIAPVLEQIAEEYDGQVKVAKINSDENFIPSTLGVMGIPTLIFYRNGEEVDRIVGAAPRYMIEEKIKYLFFDKVYKA